MPVKLSVKPASDPGDLEQYTFNKDRVTIGRDPSCDLVLPDVKRIVSKQHAALQTGTSGFEIVDLGSKNFTFLNGVRLKSNQPEALSEGDAIRIGEFEIDFSLVEAEPVRPAEADRTIFLVNPFEEPAAQLAAALSRLDAIYQKEIPGRREEALREALRTSLEEVDSEPRSAVRQALATEDEPPAAVPRTAARADYDAGPAYERAFHALLQFVPKILGLPWRFRHEFIGQTIMHTPDATALFEGEAEDVRRYLLDPSASDEELERRVTMLVESGEEVVFHALAMIDGYKAGVEHGMTNMIDEIDPKKIEEEIKRQGGALNTLPLMLESKTVARLKEKVSEMRREDWSVVERRVYRPAFIKAYLARMTSRRRAVGSAA